MKNNNVSLTGVISRGPEMRMTGNGHAMVNFTLAVDRPAPSTFTDKIRITAWEETARLIDENFNNGDEVCVNGRIQSDYWKGTDGKPNSITRVLAENVIRAGEAA